MNTKTFKKWEARVLNSWDAWTESDIVYFRKYVKYNSEHSRHLIREFLAMTSDLQDKGMHGYKLTKEQSHKGTRYLIDKSLKLNGDPRKGCKLGEFELDVLRSNAVHYLVGLWIVQSFGEFTFHLPIYRAVDKHGDWFEYTGTTYEQIMVFGNGKVAA